MSESSAPKPAASGRWTWLLFVALAGLSWGTYVPVVFYGGKELTTDPTKVSGRLMSILCVGVAYFFLAVLIPLGLFLSKKHAWPALKATGLLFSGLAGVMGAVGAIAVIFASKAAVDAAKATGEAVIPEVMVPLVFGKPEFDLVKARIDAMAESVAKEKRGHTRLSSGHYDRAAARLPCGA